MKRNDYLERILKARVYDVAIESPLERAPGLSKRLRNTLLLKREDLQPVFSFKLRGAYNKMANLPPQKLKKGVIAASAAARRLPRCYGTPERRVSLLHKRVDRSVEPGLHRAIPLLLLARADDTRCR